MLSIVRFSSDITVVLPCGTCFSTPLLQKPKSIQPTTTLAYHRRRERQGRNVEDLDEVSRGLYVGALDAAEDANVLRKYNISHVVSILSAAGEPASNHPGVCYRRFLLEDDEHADITQFFVPTFRFVRHALNSNNNNVLIHCFMGVSRSVTLACSYLMRTHRWSATVALEHIRQFRFEASPNPGFLQQLQQLEWDLHFRREVDRPRFEQKQIRLAILHCFSPIHRQHIHTTTTILSIVLAFLTS